MNFCIRVLWSWGGEPEENHPLSFVIEGSDYLRDWFGNGTQTKLFLRDVNARHVSFTLGDSGAMFQKNGTGFSRRSRNSKASCYCQTPVELGW